MTTFEAFVTAATGFPGNAYVTVFAHEPFHRELTLVIPASLGGRSRHIDWANLHNAPGAGDARFTVDADMNVLAWRVGDIDHSSL